MISQCHRDIVLSLCEEVCRDWLQQPAARLLKCLLVSVHPLKFDKHAAREFYCSVLFYFIAGTCTMLQ